MLFEIDGLDLKYQGQSILKQVSLRIAHGERVALIGKSGAGKSTLLAHLRALQPQQIAWCPQHTGLVPMLSVYHNIYMGALHRHNSIYNLANLIRPLSRPFQEVAQLADQLLLRNWLLTSVDQLSGGQQQRTAIGRALYQQKPVFIGDEPVSGLDDFQANTLLKLIAERHSTLILALHDIEQALQLCDRIIGLKDQRIALDAPSASLSAADLTPLYQ